jgi:hypothetical protein
MYRTIAYGAALIMVEVPNLCLSALFFGIPFYWMAGLRPSKKRGSRTRREGEERDEGEKITPMY